MKPSFVKPSFVKQFRLLCGMFLCGLSLLSSASGQTYTQNFDGVTAPALPSGWVYDTAAQWSTTATGAQSAPNAITNSVVGGSAAHTAFYGTPDASGNDTWAGTWYYTGGSAQEFDVIGRSTSSTFAGANCYRAIISIGGGVGVELARVASGTTTIITNGGTAQYAAAFSSGIHYNMALTCSGSTISIAIKRLSDNLYLQPGGTWGAGVASVYSVTDSGVPAASSYGGVGLYNASATAGYWDDFTVGALVVALAPGSVTPGTTTGSSAALSWAAAIGGTAPYSYQVQSAPDVAGAPGTWANTGASTSSLTQTVTGLFARRKYWFRVVTTDSAGTPATVTSGTVFATTGAAALTGVQFYHQFFAPYGAYATGLGLGYTAYDGYGNVLIAHTTANVTEQGGTGIYSIALGFDTSQSGLLVWDVPPGSAAWTEAITPTPATGTTSIITNAFQPRRGR